MVKKLLGSVLLCVCLCVSLAACGNTEKAPEAAEAVTTVAAEEATSEDVAAVEETTAEETEAEETAAACELEDGVYTAEFDTDSSMFHLNEACEGKAILTVEGGKMTIHVTLVSKNIVNLYPGLAADAEKDGAELLEPTVDPVTYSDGYKEEVYGFDIPVPYLDEEFDVALIGTKGKWYDHKVSVKNPEPQA